MNEFEVRDGRILQVAGFPRPEKRSDVFSVSLASVESPKDLAYEAQHCPPLASALHDEYTECREALIRELERLPTNEKAVRLARRALQRKLKEMPEDPEEGLDAWLKGLNPQAFEKAREVIRLWLEEEPNWVWEEDYFTPGSDGQSAALAYFRDLDFETLDFLGVEIVEGECPGSIYYAAELHKSIEEANRAAEGAGLSIRFIPAPKEASG